MQTVAVNMTRRNMLEMRAVLAVILNDVISPELAYLVSDILDITEAQAQKLAELREPSPDFAEFEEKRTKVCENYARKDSNDNPVQVVRGTQKAYDIPDDMREQFNVEVDALKEEYAEAITTREQQAATYDKLCEGTIDINVTPIPIAMLPDMPGHMALTIKAVVDTTESRVT